jgi:hypothetical protein
MTFRLNPKTLAAVSILLATSVSLGACETFEQFLSPPNKANIRGERVSVLPTARRVDADPRFEHVVAVDCFTRHRRRQGVRAGQRSRGFGL